MWSLTDDRNLHTANLLVCMGGLATAAGVIAGAGAIVGAALSLKEVARRMPTELRPLAQGIAADLKARLDGMPGLDDSRRVLLHQMIADSVPNPAQIAECGQDAGRVVAELERNLSARGDQPEYGLADNLSLFRQVVAPILTRLLNDPAFSAQLAPFRDRAFWEMREEVSETNVNVREILDMLRAQQDPRRQGVSPDDLLRAARAFGEPPDPDPVALLRFLSDKAADLDRLAREIETMRGVSDRIVNIASAAAEAVARQDLSEARTLLEGAREVQAGAIQEPLEVNDTLVVRLAEIDLIEGDANAAHAKLKASALSFAAISPEAAAGRLHKHERLLSDHGARFGGPAMTLAGNLLSTALSLIPNEKTELRGRLLASMGLIYEKLAERAVPSKKLDLFAKALDVTNKGHDCFSPDEHVRFFLASSRQSARLSGRFANLLEGDERIKMKQVSIDYLEFIAGLKASQKSPTFYADTIAEWAQGLRELAIMVEPEKREPLFRQAQDLILERVAIERKSGKLKAFTLANLALLQRDMFEHFGSKDDTEYLDKAQSNFERLLTFYKKDKSPTVWARVNVDIARTLMLRIDRLGPEGADASLDKALGHIDDALEIYDERHFPGQRGIAEKLRHRVLKRIEQNKPQQLH